LKIGDEELDYFLEKIGNDMFRISHEIEKLKYGLKENTPITKNSIDEYCF
jgi:DNA polymerase III delta subunit